MKYTKESMSADAPASIKTPYSVAVGAGFKGVFANNVDRDWVRVDLVAGKTYEINLAGADGNSDADTVLKIFNGAGDLLAENDDKDFAAGELNSMLTFSPDSSGVYYLSAGAFAGNPSQDHSGNYELTVVDPEDPGAGKDSEPCFELEGGGNNDVLEGEAGNDVIIGNGGDDTLRGAAGDDYLTGNAGADLLEGGYGADLLFGDDAPSLFNDVLLGLDESLNLSGSGDTRIDALAAMEGGGAGDAPGPFTPVLPTLTREDVLAHLNNRLAAGDDKLVGGAGDDWLEGGAGDDELLGGDDDDLLVGDSSLIYLAALALTAFAFVALPDDVDANPAPTGDSLDNVLENITLMLVIDQLTAGNDRLYGGGGDDVLEGNGGHDELSGGTGMDVLDGGDGDDVLNGDAGNDQLAGGPGADRLNGGDGNDVLMGGEGGDVLEGGAGDDRLMGDYFSFCCYYEADQASPVDDGMDTLGIGDGAVINDLDAAVASADATGMVGLISSPGPDTDEVPATPLIPAGPALVFANNDELSGGPGADWLDGGHGADRLTGGEGADIFVFAPWNGNDLVTDFHAGEDKIDLTAFTDIDSLEDLTLRQEEDNVVIDLSAQYGGEVTLQDFEASDLMEGHFIFFESADPVAPA